MGAHTGGFRVRSCHFQELPGALKHMMFTGTKKPHYRYRNTHIPQIPNFDISRQQKITQAMKEQIQWTRQKPNQER